jgi:uncharacterized membrane protein
METAGAPPLPKPHHSSFRKAILRGLGVAMPPLLTVVLFLWGWNAIDSYVLRPMENGIRGLLVFVRKDIKTEMPAGALKTDRGFSANGLTYVPGPGNQRFLPAYAVQYVDEHLDQLDPFQASPTSALAYWHLYVQMVYLPRYVVVPVFLIVFIIFMYFLGRLFAFGIGNMLVAWMEGWIHRLPLISNVYGSVKQVTDFFFSDHHIEFNRVVAVEYPRKGIWSIGFVTGQSFAELSDAANEPMLSVLMPTSPMPMTGFTVSVKRSEAIDLNITIDQAVQFVVSCGVVIPSHQLPTANRTRLPVNASLDSSTKPNLSP